MSLPPGSGPKKHVIPHVQNHVKMVFFNNDLFGGHLLSAMSLQELFRKTLHLGMCVP